MSIDSNAAGSIAFTITATDAASNTFRSVRESLDSLATSSAKLAESIGAGGAGGGFVQATQGSEQLAASVEKTTTKVGGLTKYFEDFGKQATAFAVGMVEFDALRGIFDGLSDSVIGFNAHLEQSQVAWTTFLHSSSAATQMIQGLETFAASTPFRFQGLEDAARLMTAMGVSSTKVLPLLTDIGNAVSATGRGAEGMQRVAYVMGEIQSLGQVDDRTLRQLTIDGGIPAFEMLAQAMGKSTAEIRKMASEGKISADQFMTIFHNFVANNWGDMMQKQSQTFNGALTTIQDNVQITLATAFDPLFERVRNLTVAMANFSQSSNFKDWATDTAGALDVVLTRMDAIGERPQRDIDILSRAGASATGGAGGSGGLSAGDQLKRDVANRAGGIASTAAQLTINTAQNGLVDMIPGLGQVIGLINMGDSAVNAIGHAMGYSDEQAKLFADSLDEVKRTGDDAAKSMQDLSLYTNYVGNAMGDAYVPILNASEALAEFNRQIDSKRAGDAAAAATAAAATAAASQNELLKQSIGASGDMYGPIAAKADELAGSYTRMGAAAQAAVPGLQAFDSVTFNISQQLAGVQLAIENKRLGRMERRTPHTLGQREALLQEELKVRGLERQVEFGPSLEGLSNARATAAADKNNGVPSKYAVTVTIPVEVNNSADAGKVGTIVTQHLQKLLDGGGTSNTASRRLPGGQ